MSYPSNTPTITIVGTHGMNLGRYLKEYLLTKGIKSYAVGMHLKNQSTRLRIKHANTVICMHADIQIEVEKKVNLSDKQVICLSIDDTLTVGPDRSLTGDLWLEHHETVVYPEIEKQINKHLKKLVR